jgi:hypothetical protein
MNLDGKPFRKKGYWRAIALAFHLEVELVEERREVSGRFQDGRDNFGWVVSYVAKNPSGRRQPGDGSCFAVEKGRRFKCPHPQKEGSKRSLHFPHNTCPDFDPDFQWRALPGDATEHNVRSHAHTRAYNRAVSNLVGFGEVSAEEAVGREEDGHGEEAQSVGAGQTAAAQQAAAGGAAASAPSGEAGTTKVKKVFVKTGQKTTGGEWTRYDVHFADGRKGSTFSTKDGELAQKACAAGSLVRPRLVQQEKGVDLAGFDPVVVQAPAAADEPISGPETILTIRKVKTEQGDRFIIQTDKREVVSAEAVHADEAVAARKASLRLTPKVEVIESTDKKRKINRLIEWLPERPYAEAKPAAATASTAAQAPAGGAPAAAQAEAAEKPRKARRAPKRREREPGEEG